MGDHIGFSGSRLGMSAAQSKFVYDFLRQNYVDHYKEDPWFHHGLCIGSDQQAHTIAKGLGYKIHGHPPLDQKFTFQDFGLLDFAVMDSAYSYHGRNQRINLASRILIATPYYKHQTHGGTWYTINHARMIRKPHIVFHRDGEIQQEMYDASR